MSSRRHPASATSTRKIPSEKLSARVRSATALPHATGQQRPLTRRRAMKSLSDDVFEAGGSTVQGMTPDSRMRSNGAQKDYRKGMIVASENAVSPYAADADAAAAILARFLASLRRCVAEYKLPRQRFAPHKHGASSSPS